MGEVERAISAIDWPGWAERAREILKSFRLHANQLEHDLRAASRLSVPLQPCIRDIHDEHVLFDGDAVSGIIDFGAMRHDNVATDVARLLGSMAGSDGELWRAGLAEYQRFRPMSDAELRLVELFDRSATLLGSVQWLDWIYLQLRQFDDRDQVLNRIDRLLCRLKALKEPPS